MRHPNHPAATSDRFIDELLLGKEAWNRKRASNDIHPYFSFVNVAERFKKAGKLDQNGRVPLHRYDLRNAHFHGTDLSRVDFGQADLRGARLNGVILHDTRFFQTNLTCAKFGLGYAGKADFSCATLDHADLTQLNLTGTNLGWSRFWRAKLFDDYERTTTSFSQAEPINSVADLIDMCSDLQKRRPDLTLYFRGERNSAWPLSPSVMRRANDGKFKLRPYEGEMLRDLMSRRPEDFTDKSTALEQWAVAQHHGLKTRLLDVSKNPGVALFWACDSPDSADRSFLRKMDGRLHVFGVPKELVKPFDSATVSIIANFAKLDWRDQTSILGKTGTEHLAEHPDIPNNISNRKQWTVCTI